MGGNAVHLTVVLLS